MEFLESWSVPSEAQPAANQGLTSVETRTPNINHCLIPHLPQKSHSISNSSFTARFSVEFPQSVSAIIQNKEKELVNYGRELEDGDCTFEAGYDLLPPGCWLVFKEQINLIQSISFIHFPRLIIIARKSGDALDTI